MMKQSVKSASLLWQESLRRGDKKLNKKGLRQLLAPHIVEMREEGKGQNKMTVIVSRNYLGRRVTIRNRKEADALRDVATLLGFVVE